MRDGRHFHFIFGFIFVFMFTFTKLTIVSATPGNRRVDHSKCTLQPESDRMKLQLERKIDQDNRLIKLDITVQWNSYPANDSYPNKMLWFLTADATGKHLMSLDDDFIVLSLGTLSYRITDLRISLVQEPEDCLGNLSPTDADELLKYSLLNLPKTQKAVNEEEINIFHICTGFAESGGSCCNLSLTGDDIRCQKLLDDTWMENYAKVVFILTFIFMSHSIYLIISFVYEDDNDHSYHLVQNEDLKENLKLSVKVIKAEPGLTFGTPVNRDIPIINSMYKTIETSKKSPMFYLSVKSVKRTNIELVSELSNFRLVQSLYKPFEYIFFKYNLPEKKYFNGFFKIGIILFCTSPILFSFYLSFWIHSDISPFLFLLLIIIVIVFVFACTCLSKDTFPNQEIIKNSLKKFNSLGVMNFPKFVRIFGRKHFKSESLEILYSLLIFIVISILHFTLPACLFFLIFISESLGGNFLQFKPVIFAILLFFFGFCGLFIFALCAVFYAKCIAYMLIGILLNYEQVIDTILLILMVLIYIVDCLHNVHKKIESFRQTVFKLMFELSDKTRKQLFREALKQEKNIITAMIFKPDENERNEKNAADNEKKERYLSDNNQGNDRNEENVTHNQTVKRKEENVKDNKKDNRKEKNVNIYIGDDGKPFLSVGGLCLFYNFEQRAGLPYLHIPHSFFDKLTSKPGHTYPGRRDILLLNAFKEILFLFLAILAVYFIIHGFTRNNDISAIVHTLVTLSSSAATAKLIQLVCRSSEGSLNGHDLHLKERIKRQYETKNDDWFDAEFCFLETSEADNRKDEYDILVRYFGDGKFNIYLKIYKYWRDRQTDEESLIYI